MALENISQVVISLNTSGVSRAGFGTPIFLTAQNYFTDRVRSYSSAQEVATDMTTGSNGYAGASSVFANTPSVQQYKVGRLIDDSDIFPDVLDEASVLIVGTTVSIDITDENGYTMTASYTTLGGDTVATVTAALASDINTDGTTTVTASDDATHVTVSRGGTFADGFDFTLSNISNANIAATGSPEGGILAQYTAIKEVDSDFYVVTWEDHTNLTEIRALAGQIEDEQRLYFIGTSASESITDAYTAGNTPLSTNDIAAYMNFDNNERTITWWHQDADTAFSELEFAGYNLPFDSGSVVWGNLQIGTSNAVNAEGNALTTDQQNKLADRKTNFAKIRGGIVYTREGKAAGGEWIDILRGRDNLQSDLEADLFDILTNQQGSKIPYTDAGINKIKGIIDSRLNKYIGKNFLESFTITVPKAKDISRDVKVTRTLSDISFTAKLAGAIMLVDLTGTLEV